MNNKISKITTKNELKDLFEKECSVIDQFAEYGENHLGPRWVIATSLSEEELLEKYAPIMANYDEYMIVLPILGEAFAQFKRDEQKHNKRVIRNGDISFEQGVTDQIFSECWIDDCAVSEEKAEKTREQRKLLDKAIKEFPALSKNRFKKIHVDKMSLEKIADEEKVSRSAIDHSMRLCREITVKTFESSDSIKVVRKNGIVKEVRI